MNKTIRDALLLLGVLAAAPAFAQSCPCAANQRLNENQLNSTFSNFRVTALVNAETQHVYHGTSGTLVACKRGTGHPVDPSEVVGTWSVVGNGNNATLRYAYNGGSAFQYAVCGSGNAYSYCGVSGAQNFAVTRAATAGQGGTLCTP